MPKIERFEDLRCWQKSREMTSEVYDLVESSDLSNDYRLRDQLTGAAVSTMSNIAEGFARYHKKDFIRFLDYAQSSAAEVKSLLYVVLDQKYGATEWVKNIQKQSEACQRMIFSLLKHVRSTLPGSTDEAKEPTVPYDGRGDVTEDWIFPPQFIETGSSDDGA
jgi:four helix bundle protein